MLVLSRKIGEKIFLGEDIVLEVRRIAGNRVTVAIDAPKSVRILRGELKEAAEAFPPIDPEPDVPVRSISPVENVETFVVAHQGANTDGVIFSG
jgi:carbon storage regulator